MTVFLQDPDVTIHQGDALDVLRSLPDESVDCAATSPPFYGLRDYQAEGQIGLEGSPEEWAARLVEVFREVRRVLRPSGTCWVECGDSYASSGRAEKAVEERPPQAVAAERGYTHAGSNWANYGKPGRVSGGASEGLKPKDLLGQPWLLAFALRADGWWLRQAIVWAKPNAMPESAKDRCTTAHSYVFLLSKSARYFFDADAIAEPAAWERWGDQTVPKHEGTPTAAGWIPPKSKRELQGESDHRYAGLVGQRWREDDGPPQAETLTDEGPELVKTKRPDGWASHDGGHGSFHRDGREKGATAYVNPGNRTTNGQRERTDDMRGFDNRLERADGMKHPRSVWTIPTQGYPGAHFATWPEALVARILNAGCPEGGTVLDPFLGSGTTAHVARKLGRRCIGIELNESYCQLAADRLAQQSLLAEAAS